MFRRKRFETDLDEELSLHVEMQTEANRRAGMGDAEARYAALRQFGRFDSVKEVARDQAGWQWLEIGLRDLRYSFRALGKSPVYSLVAVLSLALAIGANTLVFGLLNGVLLKSLPVHDPSRLRSVYWSGERIETPYYTGSGGRKTASGGRVSASFPYATYRDFRERAAGFTHLFAFHPIPACTAVSSAGAVVLDALMVTGNFFEGYGARPLLGRPLTDSDDSPGAPAAAVISYRLWERQFGLDPKVLGRSISINRHSFTIVGVLGPDYVGPHLGDKTDVYLPMSAQPTLRPDWPLTSYHHWWVEVMGRLASDASEQEAQATLQALFMQTLAAPGGKTKMENPRILIEDGSRGPMMMRERFAEPFYLLLGAVGLVLLVACFNLAGLSLARGIARGREFAVRKALGASRICLVRHSLTESLLLGLAGGFLGLFIAVAGKRAVLGLLYATLGDFYLNLEIDGRVLAFTFALSVFSVLLFGLLPAMRASDSQPAGALKESPTGGPSSQRLRSVLVVAQVAVSVVLLMTAGLFIHTLTNLREVDPGFNVENVFLFDLDAAKAGYEGERRSSFYEELSHSLGSLPGVQSVAFSNPGLLGGGYHAWGIKFPGRPVLPENVGTVTVSDSFLRSSGTPLLLGRELDARDSASERRVMVVNSSFVQRYLPGENPLGKVATIGPHEYEIVGVCGDTSLQDLRTPARPAVYFAFRQRMPGSVVFQLRSSLASASLAPAVRRAVAALDSSIPVTGMRTQSEQVDRTLTLERLFAFLCSMVGLLALFLSAIGLYGAIAYAATKRAPEIGVRLALGARPSDVMWSVVRRALVLATIGVALGLVCGIQLGGLASRFLYGVAPYDAISVSGSASLLLSVAVAAALIPARKAASIDPTIALRAE